MFKKAIFTLVVATAAATVAAPAFAQAVDQTGTLAASHYDGTGKQMMGSWGPEATAGNTTGTTSGNRGLAAKTRGLYAHVPLGQAPSGYDPSTQR
jgi:hypothetical protein